MISMPDANPLYKSLVINGTKEEISKAFHLVLDEVKGHHYSQDDVFAIQLAIEEAIVNAVKHGNQSNLDKEIRIQYLVNTEKFEIFITDSGCGFQPEAVPDPRNKENLYKPSGRGLLLMREYMDRVEYNKSGNQVHMLKARTEQ